MDTRKLSICVVGLGYVGLPLALELAKHYTVTGFDTDEKRINELTNGIDRNKEYTSSQLTATGLEYTGNISNLHHHNFFIVTVPTPITNGNKPDLEPLRSASELIGKYADFRRQPIIVYESTVYPGVTEEFCVPVIEQTENVLMEARRQLGQIDSSKPEYGKDFFVGYSPERINPGDTVHTVSTIIKIVSGDEKMLDIIDEVYSKITKTYRASSIKVAEAAKVIENSQRDLNIGFVNELALIFSKLGIDTLDVLDAAATKWNFLNFRPGIVGGHCIAVDPYYLTYKAEDSGYVSKVILAGRQINDYMPQHIVNLVFRGLNANEISVKNSDILILGATFKEDCNDLRNSKIENIAITLEELGATILIHDPYYENEVIRYNKTSYMGATEQDVKDITAMDNIDLVIYAVPHAVYQIEPRWGWLFNYLRNNERPIIDIKGILGKGKNIIRL